jgi:hypothetical protein
MGEVCLLKCHWRGEEERCESYPYRSSVVSGQRAVSAVGKKKDVKVTLIVAVWWVALKGEFLV